VVFHLHVGGQVIETTPEHPFYVRDKGWTPAGELEIGDFLSSEDGQWMAIDDLLDTGELDTVYNLRVADYHTYFVGSTHWGFSVWVHNTYTATVGEVAQQTKGGFSIRPLWRLKSEKHHIATIYGEVGQRLRALFDDVGVSMNSAWNLTRVSSHIGPHGALYNGYVLRTLTNATSGLSGSAKRGAFLDALWELRREIINGDLDALLKVASKT